jgi:hypothetical protein
MDVTTVTTQIEALMRQQLELMGGDEAIERATQALLVSLEPALHRAAMQLAEQAAAEVGAQLPDASVDVVVAEGDPTLVVRSQQGGEAAFSTEDLEARMTLRLPSVLKDQIENAAGDAGDSINTYVIKSLSRSSGRRKGGKRISETFRT